VFEDTKTKFFDNNNDALCWIFASQGEM